ncbi:hypothetical protein [Salegentibacter sp. T436]|uniref:hypothetical protein n=1 Tax=Salegentibacter sp. T436 TaxID=1729720 RepID=UPI000A756A51|nr:hypothetical protein [Salegentibacter sp. T436]
MKILTGIPALFGVASGILLYINWDKNLIFYLLIPVFFATLCLLIGKSIFLINPLFSMLLIEFWILLPICVVAITTALIFWITIFLPDFLDLSENSSDMIIGAFIGAITTFLSTAFMKNISDGEGFFFPTYHLKKAFNKVKLTGDNVEIEATYAFRTRNGIVGWDIISRWKRSKIIYKYLKSNK